MFISLNIRSITFYSSGQIVIKYYITGLTEAFDPNGRAGPDPTKFGPYAPLFSICLYTGYYKQLKNLRIQLVTIDEKMINNRILLEIELA